MIEFSCPRCNQPMHASEEYAGQKGTCKQCGQHFIVPTPAGSAAPSPPPPPLSPQAPPLSPPKSLGTAIASLVLGICSFALGAGPLCSIPAIITGHLALSRVKREPSQSGDKTMAVVGLVLGYLNLVFVVFAVTLLALIMMPALFRAREAAQRASCQNNLKQLGLVFKMFSYEQPRGEWPRLSSEPGRLMFSNDAPLVYPEYITDLRIMLCPADPDSPPLPDDPGELTDPGLVLDDHSYFYLGYALSSDADMQTFADAYRRRIAQGLPFDEDLEVEPGAGAGGGNKLYRLREGVERWFMSDTNDPMASSDAQSEIPVVIERLENHDGTGGSVLYLDGHVTWLPYPGKWPMTETTIGLLHELDALGS